MLMTNKIFSVKKLDRLSHTDVLLQIEDLLCKKPKIRIF